MNVYLVVEEAESGFAPPEILFVSTNKKKATKEYRDRCGSEMASILLSRIGFVTWDMTSQEQNTEWNRPE